MQTERNYRTDIYTLRESTEQIYAHWEKVQNRYIHTERKYRTDIYRYISIDISIYKMRNMSKM